jgi:hypothetical protein
MTKLQGLLKYADYKKLDIKEAFVTNGRIYLHGFILPNELRRLEQSFHVCIYIHQLKGDFDVHLQAAIFRLNEWYKKTGGVWFKFTIDIKEEKWNANT